MGESNIMGMSVRSIACIIIILSFCGLALGMKELAGLKELALIACGYLFGKQQPSQSITTGGNNDTKATITSGPAGVAVSTDPSKSGTT